MKTTTILWKVVFTLLLFMGVNEVSAQNEQTTDLLLCEPTIEFETGSSYMTRELQDDFIRKCTKALRSIKPMEKVYFRGYTSSEEWSGGNNFGSDTDSTSFSVNESRERSLSEDRAYNIYSLAVNEPDISLDSNQGKYTGTAGEYEKVVRVFRIPVGVTVEDVAKILDGIEGLKTDIKKLLAVTKDASLNALKASSDARAAREASENAARWSEKTYNLVTTLKPPRWFVKVGTRTSTMFGRGYSFAIGREFLDQNLDVYIEGYTEEKSHTVGLLYRPFPNQKVDHGGTWHTASLILRPYLKKYDNGLRLFIETGFGLVNVTYSGPPDISIGWNHTGIIPTLRAGLNMRFKRIGVEMIVGEEIWKFPQSPVLPELADNDFHIGVQASFNFSFHF